MSLFFALPSGGGFGTATISGETVTTTDTPIGSLFAGIRVNIDGTIDRVNGDDGAGGPTYTQIDSATDWIIPNTAATKRTYHFRLNKNSGDTLDAGSTAITTWVELTSTLEWWVEHATLDQDYNATLLVSSDGGSTTIDSATFIFDLNVV